MVDSLKILEILKTGSLSDSEARAMTLAIQKAESDIALDLESVIKREFAAFEARLDGLEERLQARMDARFEAVYARIADVRSDLIRWSFVFWATQWVATAGLVFAALKFAK
jgi:hypothetical protein